MRPQAWQLIVLLVVILLVFGASRLPDITRNVGKSLKIFKQEVKELRDDGEAVSDAVQTDEQVTNTSTLDSETPRGVTPPGGSTPVDGSPSGR